MRPVGYGVIGASSFVATRAVIPAIEAAEGSVLAAAASISGGTGTYEDVLTHPDVEVVYVPLPNGQHRRWTEAAAAAGKHVLCEKPLAGTSADARAMVAACDRAGVLLAEAWMTPFGARWSDAVGRAMSGALGEVREVDATFTFRIGPERHADYRWDPAEGGGALLDVGIYVLGPAVALWGAHPEVIEAVSERTERGVDVTTDFVAAWSGGRRVVGTVSFDADEAQTLTIVGTDGTIQLDADAHTGPPGDEPYRHMVEAMSRAVRGIDTWPRPATEAVEMLELVERIADSAGGR